MVYSEREALEDCFGLWDGKKTIWRNFAAHNDRNLGNTAVHVSLAEKGFLVRDPARDFGRMRVYRGTKKGAASLGKRLSKPLAAQVPETPTAH